jgi:4'-phosphopantetheinyl transferase
VRLLWDAAPHPAGLCPGEVHVWAACLDEPREGALQRLLSPDEQARATRFRFPRDRRRFVVGRGLLRGLLGRYLGVDPGTLCFNYGSRGKPSLAGGERHLSFNVTHSGALALLAFARDRELGVDLECERPLPDAEEIAQRYFSPQEGTTLGRLPRREREPAFFRCWTRKEAFIKATGDGLSRPLDGFDVTFAPGVPARLLRVEGEPGATERWWLEELKPAEGFVAALAVEGRPDEVKCWSWMEFGEESDGQRREGRRDDLQGGCESRGAVLDLAGGAGKPSRLARCG